MKIKKVELISLSKARNGEHYDFMAIAIGIFNQSSAATLNLSAFYDELHTLFLEEDTAIKIIRSSEQTPAVQQFDQERDDLYTFLYQTIEMSTKIPDAQIKQAALHLYPLMKTYKGLNRKSQRDESGLIVNLIEDLQKSTNTAAVTKLNLTATVAQLKIKNELFIESYMARADEKEQKKAVERLVVIRPRVDQAYDAAVEMLNSVYAVNEVKPTPDPAVRTLAGRMIDGLDSNAQEMKQIIATRRHRAANKKKDE